jgi:hypothetical protein
LAGVNASAGIEAVADVKELLRRRPFQNDTFG